LPLVLRARVLEALIEDDLRQILAGCERVGLAPAAALYTAVGCLDRVYLPNSRFIALLMPVDGSSSLDRFVDVRGEERVMRLALVVGIVCAVSMWGCAGLGTPPPGAPPRSNPPQGETEVVTPVVTQPSLPSMPSPTAAPQKGIDAGEPASGSAKPTTAAPTGQIVDKTAAPVAKAPAKIPATPAAAAQSSSKGSITPDIAKPKTPPLDLAALEQRLKDTKAIGVLTKIALKNQVDDLLDQFRAYYQGKFKTDLATLRRSYDLLVLKVLSLLQDSDQALAAAIVASREAIWGILSDPAKFVTI